MGRLQPRIEEGDKVFAGAKQLSEADRGAFLAQALDGLTRSYTDNPPPATFRFIVSPMVSWIWLGGLIVFGGAARSDGAIQDALPRLKPFPVSTNSRGGRHEI